ncbi:MAG: AsmA family protein, partial [Elusimicrobiota bacterium]
MSAKKISLPGKIRRALRRLIRVFFLSLFVALMIASAAVPLAFKYFIGVDTVVAWVCGELAEKFHRQIIVGEAKVSLWSGIDLSQVKISEYPSFREGVFAEVGRFNINPNLFELLAGKVRADELKIYGAKISLKRGRTGRWNVGSLTAHHQEPRVFSIGMAAESLPVDFDLDNIEITNSDFVIEDDSGSLPSAHLWNINFAARNLSLKNSFAVSGSLTAQLTGPSDQDQGPASMDKFPAKIASRRNDVWMKWIGSGVLNASFKSRINPMGGQLNRLKFDTADFEVKTSSWSLTAGARAAIFGSGTHRAKVKMNFSDYRFTLASAPVQADGMMELDLSFDFKASTKSIGVNVDADNLRFIWGNYARKPEMFPFKAAFDVRWKDVDFAAHASGARPVYRTEGGMTWTTYKGQEGKIEHWALLIRPTYQAAGP